MALFNALKNGHKEATRLLLEHGADIKMIWAYDYLKPELYIARLIEYVPDIIWPDDAMEDAICTNNYELVKTLHIVAGIPYKNKKELVIIASANHCHTVIMGMVRDDIIHPNILNDTGTSLLHRLAIHRIHPAHIRTLADKGANLYITDDTGKCTLSVIVELYGKLR